VIDKAVPRQSNGPGLPPPSGSGDRGPASQGLGAGRAHLQPAWFTASTASGFVQAARLGRWPPPGARCHRSRTCGASRRTWATTMAGAPWPRGSPVDTRKRHGRFTLTSSRDQAPDRRHAGRRITPLDCIARGPGLRFGHAAASCLRLQRGCRVRVWGRTSRGRGSSGRGAEGTHVDYSPSAESTGSSG